MFFRCNTTNDDAQQLNITTHNIAYASTYTSWRPNLLHRYYAGVFVGASPACIPGTPCNFETLLGTEFHTNRKPYWREQRYAQPLATQPHFSYTQGIASCNTEPRHIPVQYGTADPQLPHRAQEHPTQRYKIEFFFSDLSPLWGSWLGPPPIIFTRNSFIYLLMQRLPALNLPARGAGRTLRQFPLETDPRAISQ